MAGGICSNISNSALVDRVVIVGGGLGGLSVALQLRSRGIDAHVYERNNTILGGPGTGTMISLFPNGCRALHQVDPDLVRRIEEKGMSDKQALGVDEQGKLLNEWSLARRMRETYGQPMIAVLWRDALQVLADSLPEECKHTGYECLEVRSEGESPTVLFRKDGGETVSVTAPLVVGADGIRSKVRSCLFGSDIQPRDLGRTMWRAVIDAGQCTHPALQKPGSMAGLNNGRTIFIVNGVRGKLYWAFSLTDEHSDGRAKVRSKDPQETMERLLEEFRDWDVALDILRFTNPALILERRVLDLPVLRRWSRGRVVLLGDAVHAVPPSLGQGANMAYEDGLELALQLCTAPDVDSAISKYEEVRRPRAEEVSEKSQNVERSQEFYDWLYTYDRAQEFC